MKRQVEILTCDICKSVFTMDAELSNCLQKPMGKNIGTYKIPIRETEDRITYEEVNICSDCHCISKALDIVIKYLDAYAGETFIAELCEKEEDPD